MTPRFEVFKVMHIHVEIFWIMTPCHEVVEYQRFGGPCWIYLQGGEKILVYSLRPQDGGSHVLPKHWYPTTSLRGTINQKTSVQK